MAEHWRLGNGKGESVERENKVGSKTTGGLGKWTGNTYGRVLVL